MDKQIVKPSILPGFMELLPSDQILFNKMLDTIRKNYEKYGFIPVDTPMIEKSEILLAKGGGETEKQIYRFTKGDSDLSLRFDLTVPLARYVAQHFSDLNFPFRRYHISKVFRGERNQKGRFREFYQCDIDIIGNNKLSIVNDAEIPSIIYSTFKDLGFDSFTIHINNRKILNGFYDALEIENKIDVLRTIDKLDKIGIAAVKEELSKLEISEEKTNKIVTFIEIDGTNSEIISELDKLDINNEIFIQGVEELKKVIHYIGSFNVPEKSYKVDLKIARGLDYYTGTIYETTLDDYPQIGSVCSGGRYDNLADYYTKEKLPGVGISIGLTRLFYQLREANIISNESSSLTQLLILPLNTDIDYSIKLATELRKNNIISEVYFDEVKMNKKMNYADKLGIPLVLFIGDEEIQSGILTLKDMKSGEQFKLTLQQIIDKVGE